MAGFYFSVGKPNGVLCVAEGLATGASIYEATKHAVAVAFNAGNLEPVARALRRKFPDARLIVCADNDADKKPNIGVEAATKAARATAGLLAVPELDGTKADFNDLHRQRGAAAVIQTIQAARVVPAVEARSSESHSRTTADTVDAHPWPDELDEAAFHGLAGDIVNTIAPQSEADRAALLVETLVAFGALVGRGPHVRVEGDEHHSNIYALLIGETAKARKGTSWGRVQQIFDRLAKWPSVKKGLSTGEGLKWAVRDPIERSELDKQTGQWALVQTDPGISDKRLLVIEEEFAQSAARRATPGKYSLGVRARGVGRQAPCVPHQE